MRASIKQAEITGIVSYCLTGKRSQVRIPYVPQLKINHLSILFGRWFFDSALFLPQEWGGSAGLFRFK